MDTNKETDKDTNLKQKNRTGMLIDKMSWEWLQEHIHEFPITIQDGCTFFKISIDTWTQKIHPWLQYLKLPTYPKRTTSKGFVVAAYADFGRQLGTRHSIYHYNGEFFWNWLFTHAQLFVRTKQIALDFFALDPDALELDLQALHKPDPKDYADLPAETAIQRLRKDMSLFYKQQKATVLDHIDPQFEWLAESAIGNAYRNQQSVPWIPVSKKDLEPDLKKCLILSDNLLNPEALYSPATLRSYGETAEIYYRQIHETGAWMISVEADDGWKITRYFDDPFPFASRDRIEKACWPAILKFADWQKLKQQIMENDLENLPPLIRIWRQKERNSYSSFGQPFRAMEVSR